MPSDQLFISFCILPISIVLLHCQTTQSKVITFSFKVKLTLAALHVRFQFEALEAATGIIGNTAMSTVALKIKQNV